MTRQERENAAIKAYNLLLKAHELMNDIIWERQEGQPEHFDKLAKLEKLKIIATSSHIKSGLQEISYWQDVLRNL